MSTRVRSVLAALVVVVAAGAVVASGSSNTASKVDSGSKTSGGTTAKAASSYNVGDEVKLGDWTVKVWAVANPQAPVNQFSQPAAGQKWVGLDTEVKNLSSKPETVSSILCFDVTDSANRKYNVNITSGVEPGAPDGEVAPNGALRGTAVFEVPADATGLKLNFKCDLLSSGTATINLGV